MKKEEKVVSKETKRKELGQFIKTHVLKKTKILTIIGILLFIVITYLFAMSDVEFSDEIEIVQKASLIGDVKDRIIILILILLAGWVAYFYIPVVAYVAYIIMLAGNISLVMDTKGLIFTSVISIIPVLLDIFTTSIITAIGIYMCNYSTKKRRYIQSTSFSFLDIKERFYEMTKKQEKYEEIVQKKQEKYEKMEENNVNIDYKNIIKIAPAIVAINIIVCIIEHFIIN